MKNLILVLLLAPITTLAADNRNVQAEGQSETYDAYSLSRAEFSALQNAMKLCGSETVGRHGNYAMKIEEGIATASAEFSCLPGTTPDVDGSHPTLPISAPAVPGGFTVNGSSGGYGGGNFASAKTSALYQAMVTCNSETVTRLGPYRGSAGKFDPTRRNYVGVAAEFRCEQGPAPLLEKSDGEQLSR